MCHLFTNPITVLADLAMGVPEEPTPASTPTPDEAEEAPPTPTTASGGPSPAVALGAPASTSAAAMLPVVDDSDALKDAAGQHLPSVCIHLLLLHVHALLKQSCPQRLSMSLCYLEMGADCLMQVSNKRDVVLAAACLSRVGFAKHQHMHIQTLHAKLGQLPVDVRHDLHAACTHQVLMCQRSQSYLVLVC